MTGASDFQPILYFDGVCNLCNTTVDALIRSRRGKLRFASLQGQTAAERVPADLRREMKSLILEVSPGRFLTESTAALNAFGGFWRVFLLVPPFLRNAVYRGVAKNRYTIFGKRDTCRLPMANERSYFLP